jgi:(1->4)-alpha-D-glucan 1-alpha-D-glucosylmutase
MQRSRLAERTSGSVVNQPAPPRSTVRLQFHSGFTLTDAAELVEYFAQLGISHLYASPLFSARRGSAHGYDVTDYATINPELGGRAGLERLVAALHQRDMGLILDIVPNHMAADSMENPWWRDMLAKGEHSPYAEFFDIDWLPPQPWLRGKVLLPVLGRSYAEAIANDEIRIDRETNEVTYFDHRFPLAEGTGNAADLDAILEAQHYRLGWWRTAGDTINWRRFFDINGLAALRADRAEVFEATHALVLELFATGLIDGVRVDHIDGLADPAAYCQRLRHALTKAGNRNPYIVVEKILAPGEMLPGSWGVDGTTGYDFMAEVGGLMHDRNGEATLTQLWERITGNNSDFRLVSLDARNELLLRLFSADLDRAMRALAVDGNDVPAASLRRSAVTLASNFSVYRLYPHGDFEPLKDAYEAAKKTLPRAERAWLERLQDMLTAPDTREGQVRFQLVTAPLAAKAVEDTAFYRYGRLLSCNEVGSSPEHFAYSPRAFHQAVLARQQQHPHAMLATATHDHKRGEDTRARLAVLSEIPAEWADLVDIWMRLNEPHRTILPDGVAPSPADEMMLYQTLVAAWPAQLDPTDNAGVTEFAARVAGWQQKALREAKLRSDWAEPDEAYEAACREFLMSMLANPTLRQETAMFAARIGPAGAVNGLTQTMLRLTLPGVPDLYQGTEFWDESLVDPDNRRAVDFTSRKQALTRAMPISDLLDDWESGHVKQAVIARMLTLRAQLPRLFAGGTYRPLDLSGPREEHALAFLREEGAHRLLVAVTRLPVPLLDAGGGPRVPPASWSGTTMHVPKGVWQNALEATTPLEGTGTLELATVFRGLPVACWLGRISNTNRVHRASD